jgi:hypothetical protein
MGSIDKRRIALAATAIGMAGLLAFGGPIADIRVTHDSVASTAISKVEAKVDLGLVAFSFLHSWKRVLR